MSQALYLEDIDAVKASIYDEAWDDQDFRRFEDYCRSAYFTDGDCVFFPVQDGYADTTMQFTPSQIASFPDDANAVAIKWKG